MSEIRAKLTSLWIFCVTCTSREMPRNSLKLGKFLLKRRRWDSSLSAHEFWTLLYELTKVDFLKANDTNFSFFCQLCIWVFGCRVFHKKHFLLKNSSVLAFHTEISDGRLRGRKNLCYFSFPCSYTANDSWFTQELELWDKFPGLKKFILQGRDRLLAY